jgi:DNA-binding CsgD family transcriptional regulator
MGIDVPQVRAFTSHDWPAEYTRLAESDQGAPLSPEDLERWAVAAHLIGEDDQVISLRDRAYRNYLDRGLTRQAARCIFWIGFHLDNAGRAAQAAGWLERLRRILAELDEDDPLWALEWLALAFRAMQAADAETAIPLFDQVSAAARRTNDEDLLVLAGIGRGNCLIMLGNMAGALDSLDEAMLYVTAEVVAPQVAGLAYCSVISACMERFDLQRAAEWTRALAGWCDAQSGLVPYRGVCQIHRAEILHLLGSWTEAAEEAERARNRLASNSMIIGGAQYRLAELHRLHGRFDLAERAYAAAASCGHEVQPGLAQLRAAQGRAATAAAGLDRALAENANAPERPRLLAARVEVALQTADLSAASVAASALADEAGRIGTPYVEAQACHAQGRVLLAQGEPQSALPILRRAWGLWQRVDVPYEAAKTRLEVGAACRALGDEDAERMEIDAARTAFQQLGASADLAAIDHYERGTAEGPLTAREKEVLHLVAHGGTNRAIAAELFLSEKTVARHLSNIFVKLGVSSRSSAASYAYEHGLA